MVRVPIAPRETAATLGAKLASAGAEAIVAALRSLDAEGALPSVPQPDAGACYAPKIDRAEAAIDWRASAEAIDRQVRAFDPVPGAATRVRRRSGEGVEGGAFGASGAGGAAGDRSGADSKGMRVACGGGAFKSTKCSPRAAGE